MFFKIMFKNNMMLCLVFTILFSIVTYATSAITIKNEYENTVKSELKDISSNMNERLLRSQEFTEFLRKNEIIYTYAKSQQEDNYLVTKVNSFLKATVSSYTNPYFMVGISKIVNDKIITNSSSMSLKYYKEELNISDDVFNSVIQELKSDPLRSGIPIISQVESANNTEDVLTIVTCERIDFDTPIYVFATFRLSEIINATFDDDSSLIISLNNNLFYNNKNLDDKVVNSVLNEKNLSKYTVFKYDENKGVLFRNLSYYFIIPKTKYLYTLNRNILLVIGICTILFLLGYVASYFLTKKAYSPMQKLLLSIGEQSKPITKLNNINEIAYISDIIANVKQDNKKLRTQITQSQSSLNDKFVSSVMFGKLCDEEIESGIKQYNIKDSKNGYITAILEFTNHEEILHTFKKNEVIMIKQTIIAAIEKGFSDYSFFKILDIYTDKHVIVSSIKESTESFIINLKHILNQIDMSLDIEMFASVGSTVNSFSETDKSFTKALYVSQHRILGIQHFTICTVDDIKDIKTDLLFYPVEIENKIITETINGKIDEVEKLYNQLIDSNFPNGTFSKEQISQFTLMLTATFNRIISSINTTADEIFEEGTIIFLELKSCDTINVLKKKILELTELIVKNVDVQKNDLNKKTSQLILSFIDENYTKDISLYDISEYLNISQEHASRMFKKLIHDNFKNYLSHYRYQKAKEIMLTSPNKKLKDVATAVGCNNTVMLSRLFQKYEGVSASNYLNIKQK